MKKVILCLLMFQSFAFATTSTIKFVAKTNGPGITVEGEVNNSETKVDFSKLETSTFSTDVMNLVTGMEKRDKHLHEKLFNISSAGLGKIDYTMTNISCPKEGNIVDCDCIGKLKILNTENEIKFKVNLDRVANVITGKTIVSLNQFKLSPPSFMGITVLDEVEVEFKVSAK